MRGSHFPRFVRHRRRRLLAASATIALIAVVAATVAVAAITQHNMPEGATWTVHCPSSLIVSGQNQTGISLVCATTTTLNATTTTQASTTTTGSTTTTSSTSTTTTSTSSTTTSTTIPSSSVAFVQADDTGTINGNTTSICSGCSNQVLAHNTGVGHSVVLMIQTLTAPGTQTDTVNSISTGMGTFQFVNSYNDGADYEIWVCLNTTGAADTITVNTPTNAWDALAIEFNKPATGFMDGGGQVANLDYLATQSWTVSPGAAGNLAVVGVDTADAYESAPAAPWTYYNSGYWSFFNGTSAAWQVAPSSSPLTASWVQDGGLVNSQGVVLQY